MTTKPGIVGRTYLERGEPVTVLVQWVQVPKAELLHLPGLALKATTPRNVLIRRADGTEAVRPFRGLRKVSPCDSADPGDSGAPYGTGSRHD
jgi:hypothetical protein